MEQSFVKLFNEVINTRTKLAPCTLFDKKECIYDASQSLYNSVDAVSSKDDIHPGGLFATKTLYINLVTMEGVSKPYIQINQANCLKTNGHLSNIPYLGITLERICSPIEKLCDQMNVYVSNLAKVASSNETHLGNPPSLFEYRHKYSLNTFRNLESGSIEEDKHFELPNTPSSWPENDFHCATEIGITKDTLKVLTGICGAKDINQADLVKSAISECDAMEFIRDLPIDGSVSRIISMKPEDWTCDDCGQKTQNLWLNLSDGYIGCGRRQYGIETSGCGCANGKEGAAIRHYEANPDYHVCLKLGTISPVSADVYSYKLDMPVIDEELDSHLERFGLQRNQMVQSSKSTSEIAAEKNEALKFGVDEQGLNSSGKRLRNDSGKIGITNIGNSCYVATILHILSVVYYGSNDPVDSAIDVLTNVWQRNSSLGRDCLSTQLQRQLVPLCHRLPKIDAYYQSYDSLRSQYFNILKEHEVSQEDITRCLGPDTSPGTDLDPKLGVIAPTHFKLVAARKNRLFGNAQQQDAEDFFQFIFEHVKNEEKQLHGKSTMQEKLELLIVTQSGKEGNPVISPTPVLSLSMPLSTTDSLNLTDLITHWNQGDIECQANIKSWIAHFPQFIVVKVQRISYDEEGNLIKLSNSVTVPEKLDLGNVRVPDELYDKAAAGGSADCVPQFVRETLRTQLGFSDNQINAAGISLGKDSENLERMTDWILSNPEASVASDYSTTTADIKEEDITTIISLGFERPQAQRALKRFKNNLEAAVESLLTQSDFGDVDTELNEPSEEHSSSHERQTVNTSYTLEGVIIHIGSNTHSGHYIAYIRKSNRWLLFNDETVLEIEAPELNFNGAYLCLYKRSD